MFFSSQILALGALLSAIAPVNGVIVRISPLGDSLTGGPVSVPATLSPYQFQNKTLTRHQGCWRALLWQQLQAAGITNTDFVGTQYVTNL